MKNSILHIKNVTLEFKSLSAIQIFNNLEFGVQEKELIGIMGPSGSGKTTLFRLIMGFISPTSGTIETSMKPVLIPQIPVLNPFLTINELIELELINNTMNYEIDDLLDQFDLSNFNNQIFSSLSGGQKQRVVLLTKIISQNKFILADEPFHSLDKRTSEITRDFFFDQIKKNNITTILTSHNPAHLELMDKIYRIENQKLIQV